MKAITTAIAVALMVFAGVAVAGGDRHASRSHDFTPRDDLFEYARVLDVQPIYRQVRTSAPVRECWDEPVYHTRQQPKSAGGMLAGGCAVADRASRG